MNLTTAPHYFYVPYSSDPQDGLKLVRLGKPIKSQLSQPNMKNSSVQPELKTPPFSNPRSMQQDYDTTQSTQYYYQQLPEHQYYYQQPQSTQYFYQQTPEPQPLQHYFREPQSQFPTFQMTCPDTQSEYFYRKFQQQQLRCRYFQELSLKQQDEVLFLRKALKELQYIIICRLREK